MKYYTIREGSVSVGVIFYDSLNAFYSLRSVTESLQVAFDLAANLTNSRFIKDVALQVVPYGANDSNWIDDVLGLLCGDFWSVGMEGKCLEADMDSLIGEHLGWSLKDGVSEKLNIVF